MAVFKNNKEVGDAETDGRVRDFTWRKTPSQTTTAGLWFDLALSPGNPPPKYYFDAPPLIAKAMSQSADGGIFHGANVSPSQKHLRKITAFTATATALPMSMWLMDYLLYYPSIDDSTTDPQVLDSTVALPRYSDGKGVMVMAISVAGRTGGRQFFFTYTNSDGVAGRTSQIVTENTSTAIGVVVTSATATQASGNPFIGLQSGDDGVRSIESVTMLGADVGLFALVLVKPLATTLIRGVDAPVEIDFLIHKNELPRIYDDAFLSFICLPNGTLSATALIGDLKCVWTAS
jgi:hypothetical protein